MDRRDQGADDGGMRDEMDKRLQARLTAVEGEVGRLRSRARWLAGGLVAVTGIALVAALAPNLLSGDEAASVESLRVQHLVLVDDEGIPRGEWVVDDEGHARITMMDRQRRQRLSLLVQSGGFPGVSLTNAAGQKRIALGVLPDETSSLVFADAGGVPRTVLGLTQAEVASLVFADAEGVSRIGLGLDRSGLGSVMLPEDGASPAERVDSVSPSPAPGGDPFPDR